MKFVFLGSFTVLAMLSVVATLWQPEDPDGRIVLVYGSDDNPMRHEQMAQFNRMQDKYRVVLDPQNMDKIIVQSIGGVGPDFFSCYSPDQLSMHVRAGIALDVTDALAARGIDLGESWDCLQPVYEWEGRIYGHPDNVATPVLFYNKDLFDAAGEPYPSNDWTWDEMVEAAKRLTLRDSRGRPVQFGLMTNTTWDWRMLRPNWNAPYFNEEGTRFVMDCPEGADMLRATVYDPLYVHRITPTPVEELAMASAGGWGTGLIDQFGAGKGAMAVGGRWWLCLLRDESYADLRMGVATIPKGPGGGLVIGYGKSTLVNANSENIEGALEWLAYMHSPEWSNLLNRQADGLGPIRKYAYTDDYLFDPEYPDEDFNEVFRTALENAVRPPVSRFANGQRVDIITNKHVDLLRNDQKTPEEAARDMAREVNEAIVIQLRRDPELREKYMRLVEQGAAPAWDSPEDAP